MTTNLGSETIREENLQKDSVLYFLKDISTEEGLEIIKKRKFKCGYKYVIEAEGKTIIRAIFYNHKYDLLSIRYSEDKFYLQEEASRLYINRQVEVSKGVFKAKHFLPINPFNEYPHTRSVIPNNVEPIDIDNIDNIIGYQLRLVPENCEIEMYRRNKIKEINETIKDTSEKSKALEDLNNIFCLANIYRFDQTYEELDETLKILYKPLLQKHKIEFYNRVISLISSNNDDIITELLNLLDIVLDKETILKEIKVKQRYNNCTNKTLIQILKDLKNIITKINENEDIFTKIAKHSEWFERKEQTSTLGHTLKLSI